VSPALPARPSLEHLKKQAKALFQAVEERDPGAIVRYRAHIAPDAASEPKLADALHVIAREHDFASWPELKDHVESLARRDHPRAALMHAVETRDVAAARALLEAHADLRATLNEPAPELSFGQRPIHGVVSCGQREMIDLFLHYGADLNARTDWWAGSFGVLDAVDPELAAFLIQRGATVDAHAAARLGMRDRLAALVAADPAVVHARGGDGQTPLHFASSIEIADFLLEHGADFDALDVDHEGTPAQWMVRDRPEVARHLVRRGCRTDLLLAVALGEAQLVRQHLDSDPAAIRTSVTPRFFPMRDRRAGGHIYIWTLGKNKSAHAIARDFARHEVFAILMERSPAELALSAACEIGDDALVRSLVERTPELAKLLSPTELRKLPDAAQDENAAAVRLMLSAGWPLDARGDEGATALHWAAWLGHAEIVRLLLRHHAPLDVRDQSFGGTPLTWALHGSQHGWRKDRGDFGATVDALLDAGAPAPKLTPDLDASDAARAALRRHAGRA
jgi:ankyrin repeat protein